MAAELSRLPNVFGARRAELRELASPPLPGYRSQCFVHSPTNLPAADEAFSWRQPTVSRGAFAKDEVVGCLPAVLVIGAHMLVFALLCCAGCCGSNRRCPAFLCVNKWRFEFADRFPTFAAALRKFDTCAEACLVKQGFVRCCRCFALCCGDGLAPLKLWQKLACSWCAMVNYEGQTWRCWVVFVCDSICCLFARWYTAFAWEPRLAANSRTSSRVGPSDVEMVGGAVVVDSPPTGAVVEGVRVELLVGLHALPLDHALDLALQGRFTS